jgi:hypothetical protein
MSKRPNSSLSLAILTSLGCVFGANGAGTETNAVPNLASADFGWLAGIEFLPPEKGPGPVRFDKAHPYVRNNTPGQPTFRIADVSNPILRPWVVERMLKDTEEDRHLPWEIICEF